MMSDTNSKNSLPYLEIWIILIFLCLTLAARGSFFLYVAFFVTGLLLQSESFDKTLMTYFNNTRTLVQKREFIYNVRDKNRFRILGAGFMIISSIFAFLNHFNYF